VPGPAAGEERDALSRDVRDIFLSGARGVLLGCATGVAAEVDDFVLGVEGEGGVGEGEGTEGCVDEVGGVGEEVFCCLLAVLVLGFLQWGWGSSSSLPGDGKERSGLPDMMRRGCFRRFSVCFGREKGANALGVVLPSLQPMLVEGL